MSMTLTAFWDGQAHFLPHAISRQCHWVSCTFVTLNTALAISSSIGFCGIGQKRPINCWSDSRFNIFWKVVFSNTNSFITLSSKNVNLNQLFCFGDWFSCKAADADSFCSSISILDHWSQIAALASESMLPPMDILDVSMSLSNLSFFATGSDVTLPTLDEWWSSFWWVDSFVGSNKSLLECCT